MKNKKNSTLRIPKHIAFIMDGNGRWAKKRGLHRYMGHRKGIEILRPILKRCFELDVQTVSVFAFSTENWNRPQEEVDEIMRLATDFLKDSLSEFLEHGIKLIHSGNTDRLPQELKEALFDTIAKTSECKKHTVNICLNYGGRSEIVNAINGILKTDTKVITEKEFVNYLQHSDVSEPDIIVRTSGENRISNFMLWQAAYSEFYFTKTYWPDFTPKMVDKVVRVFNKRERRFGAIKV